MSELLRKGQVVSAGGSNCRIEDFLGGGGQGEVYRARLGPDEVALKWYHSTYLAENPHQRAALEWLIKRGPPRSNGTRFLWPLALATTGDASSFGYVMPLREPRFKGLVLLMRNRLDTTLRSVAMAGYELAENYRTLHAEGLCYRDISFGNVAFDPATGEVRICDNDNVCVNGDDRAGVSGTPRFMAPEIVRGEAKPSTATDVFSLAVLLFYMLNLGHPLEGKTEAAIKCFDWPAMQMLYGTKPVFIFDPANDSNRPVPGYQGGVDKNWSLLPRFMKDLFVQAFTTGLRDAQNGRVSESQWRDALLRLRDSVIECGSCEADSYFDLDGFTSHSQPGRCWNCKRALHVPLRLHVGRHVVVLNRETVLQPHHVDPSRSFEFSPNVASVSRHPTDASIWGLKNETGVKWTATISPGKLQDVPPGRNVTLSPGTRINFGTSEGVVQQ